MTRPNKPIIVAALIATASVALQMEGETVQAARVVLGHVAPVPWEAPAAARSLIGKTLTEETAAAAAVAAVEGARPLSRNRYKVGTAHAWPTSKSQPISTFVTMAPKVCGLSARLPWLGCAANHLPLPKPDNYCYEFGRSKMHGPDPQKFG